jgi:hypothetical protein
VIEQPLQKKEGIHGSTDPISRRNQGSRPATAAGRIKAKDPEGPPTHGAGGVIHPNQEQKHRMVKL